MSVSHGTLLLPASGYQLDLSEPELLQAAPLGSRLAWHVSQYAPTLAHGWCPWRAKLIFISFNYERP